MELIISFFKPGESKNKLYPKKYIFFEVSSKNLDFFGVVMLKPGCAFY